MIRTVLLAGLADPREIMLAKKRAYYRRNRRAILEKRERYYRENYIPQRERIARWQRNEYLRDPELIRKKWREQARKYRQRNPLACAQACKRWREKQR